MKQLLLAALVSVASSYGKSEPIKDTEIRDGIYWTVEHEKITIENGPDKWSQQLEQPFMKPQRPDTFFCTPSKRWKVLATLS